MVALVEFPSGVDGLVAPQLGLDGTEDAALLSGDEDAARLGRIVSAVSIVDVDPFDLATGEAPGVLDGGPQGVAVVGIARQDVLDSFLGSGTTAAVAHKMGRRYIGVEAGEHAVSHCAPRLKKVIDGEQGGISTSVGWQGGGGYRFYRLGSPVFDEQGHIRPDISFAALAAHVWFSETATPWVGKHRTPFLGIHNGQAIALLYNGILGDKRPNGGNVLTRATLALIRAAVTEADPTFSGLLTVYGEQSRIGALTLERETVTFKQTPYDIKARR